MKISSKQYVSVILRFASTFLLLFLLMTLALICFSDVKYAPEWISTVVFAVVPVFYGLPSIGGCVAAYFAVSLLYGYTPELSLFFTFAKLPIAFAAFTSRKYARRFSEIRQIASYAAFCVFGCFISFILQSYYAQIRVNSPITNDVYSILNLLTSNICCAVAYGMPLCALIMRILYGRDPSADRNESAQVNMLLCFLPLFTSLFLFLFWKCQATFAVSEEYWCKAFLYASAPEIDAAAMAYMLTKWKRPTLLAGAALLCAIIIVGIVNHDPAISILIVGAAMLYLLIRAVRFGKIEAALDARKPIRRAVITVNVVFISILMLVNALNAAILVMPSAEDDEPYTIVLGAPVLNGEPSDALRDRNSTAGRYARRNPDSLFFVTGGVKTASAGVSEADVIGLTLTLAGVPSEQIYYEREALTTLENFQNIAAIFDENGYDKDAHIALLTSEFHYPRAILYAKKAGFHNLVCLRTDWSFFSNALWSIREAIVFLPSLF